MLLHAFDFLHLVYKEKSLEQIVVHSYVLMKIRLVSAGCGSLINILEYERSCSSCKYFFLTLLKFFANITADNKVLYVAVGWEGWSFIAKWSNLAFKLLQQLILSFLGDLGEVPYKISIRLTQWQEQILKDFEIRFLVSFLVWSH